MMEALLILPTTYLTTRVHSILKKHNVNHDMVIKPSAIFSDCGLAISIEKEYHSNVVEILNTNGLKDFASYIKPGTKWISYGE